MAIGKQQRKTVRQKQWELDQADPDNWFTVPEFGVTPQSYQPPAQEHSESELEFSPPCFAHPIQHPHGQDREIRDQVRNLVRSARKLVRLEFESLAAMHAAYAQALDLFIAAPDGIDLLAKKDFDSRLRAAVAYEMSIFFLRKAIAQVDQRRSTKGSNPAGLGRGWKQTAQVAAVLLDWATDESGPRLLQLFRRELVERAKKAAHARHADDRGNKQFVREWYVPLHANYSSTDAAALDARKIVPMKFSTLRTWIGDFRREIKQGKKASES